MSACRGDGRRACRCRSTRSTRAKTRLRASRLASSLPRPGTSEGTAAAPLADPAAGDRTRGRRRGGGARADAPTVRRPRTSCCRTRRRGWRSAASRRRCWPIRWPGRCSRDVTAAVDVTDAEVARLPSRATRRRFGTRTACDASPTTSRGCGPAPRVPAVAGRAVRRAGRARPGLRASRRSASARQHPQALMADSRWRSTSAARRSPRASSTPTARWSTTPSCRRRTATPKRCGRWSTRWSPRRSPTAGGRVRGVGIASAGPIDLPAGTVSPINITAVATLSDRRAGVDADRCPGAAGRRRAVHGAGGAVARRGPRRRSSCSAWWCRPASAAGWCSTARPTTAAPATPATSATSSSTPTAGRARAAAAAASRRSPRDRDMAQWAREQRVGCAGRGRREGTRRRRQRGRPGRAAGVPPRCDGGGGDDRVGGGGVRPRPRRHRRRRGQVGRAAVRPAARGAGDLRRAGLPPRPAGACPPSSAATRAWSARRLSCATDLGALT